MSAPPDLAARLAPFLKQEKAPGDGAFQSISLRGLAQAAAMLGRSVRESMILCLEQGIWPARFCRNRGIFSAQDQAALLRAHVFVLGCGGLGGHVALLLARLGVGLLSVCDGDVFEESNLNRQRLCREDRIGMNKAHAAAEELAAVASHVSVRVFAERADAANLPAMLEGARILVDCLDDIPSRRAAEAAARNAGIPFVHGAIAGREGFAFCSSGTVEESALDRLYPEDPAKEHRAEHRLGVPTLTPAVTAILQCEFVLRELTGKRPDRRELALWHVDLSVPEIEVLAL